MNEDAVVGRPGRRQVLKATLATAGTAAVAGQLGEHGDAEPRVPEATTIRLHKATFERATAWIPTRGLAGTPARG